MMMNEINTILTPNLDAVLNKFYAAQVPNATFAVNLEAQLRQRQRELVSHKQEYCFSFAEKRRAMIQKLRKQPVLALSRARKQHGNDRAEQGVCRAKCHCGYV